MKITNTLISILILPALLSVSLSSQAGFGDSLRELKGTLTELTDTNKEITGFSKEVVGNRASTQPQYTAGYHLGQNLSPKVNNRPLYQSANKSAPVMTKLSKSSTLVFAGNSHHSGLIEVTTDYGNGWIEAHLVH